MTRLLIGGILAMFLGTTWEAAGQERPFEVEMRTGYAYPQGALSEFLEAGPTMWFGGRYRVTDRIAVRGEIGQSFLFGREVERPSPRHRFEVETRVRRALGGVDIRVASADGSRPGASLRLSGGRTAYRDDFGRRVCPATDPCSMPRAELLASSWTVGVGGRVNYEIRSGASVSITADWIRAFQEQEDIVNQAFFGGATTRTAGFDAPSVMPVTVGLGIGF